MSYSNFIHGLKVANVRLDRKALADLAVRDEAAFAAVVDVARTALA
jgi:large subunit ribosomal protein L20